MATHKIKSYAKINLALNIVGKTSSLHKIETIVAFIDLFDDILIEKIKSKKNKIEECLFVAGSKINYDNELLIRNSGCAALDMAYVASGRYDGFFQKDLKIWDIAAGIILVKEAGGIINDINLDNIENLKVIVSSVNIRSKFEEKLTNF